MLFKVVTINGFINTTILLDIEDVSTRKFLWLVAKASKISADIYSYIIVI